MSYNKNEVKDQLNDEEVLQLLEFFEAEPMDMGDHIICKTICHNGDSHKLYYYKEQRLFKCYTQCDNAFDIFELVTKIKEIDLNQAIYFIVNFFNLRWKITESEEDYTSEDWKLFNRYNKLEELKPSNKELITLPEYDKNILKYYPQPRYLNWEKEGISKEVCDYMDIHYNPCNGSILIPHYDENNRLVGIRERTLIQEKEQYGKYRPAKLQGELCNHPLSFNLYGLNKAKNNINKLQTAIILESEKAVIQYMSYFGIKNSIAVAVCGGSLSKYQFNLLLAAGAKEIVIGFDKDFQEIGDDNWEEVVKKLTKMYNKFSNDANISFLFDTEDLLDYKSSPTDHGRDAFLYLFRNRVVL